MFQRHKTDSHTRKQESSERSTKRTERKSTSTHRSLDAQSKKSTQTQQQKETNGMSQKRKVDMELAAARVKLHHDLDEEDSQKKDTTKTDKAKSR